MLIMNFLDSFLEKIPIIRDMDKKKRILAAGFLVFALVSLLGILIDAIAEAGGVVALISVAIGFLLMAGLILCGFIPQLIYLAYVGVAGYGLCALFQLVTLPTEFDASRRALRTIDGMGLLEGEEYAGAKKVLTAAALTYVAALATTLMQLLRFLIILNDRRR